MPRSFRLVAVASLNPVKFDAVSDVVRRLAPEVEVVAVAPPAGLDNMPATDQACLAAARQRAAWAVQHSDADLGFGLEGGVQPSDLGLLLTGWVVAQHRDGRIGIGGGGRLPLPRAIGDRVLAGEELGPVMDDVVGRKGVKHDEGAVGVLTAGLLSRRQTFAVAVSYALAPFVAPDLYGTLASVAE